MLKTVKFELIKLFTSKKFYVIGAVLVGASIFMGFAIKAMNNMNQISEKIFINAQNYPLFVLEQFINDLLPIMLIILLGGLISDEYRDGTLKLILLRPVKRMEVLAAKITVIVVATMTYLATAMISGYAAGLVIFGWGHEFFLPRTEIAFSAAEGILKTVLAYGMTLLPLVTFLLIILLLSIVISNSSMVLGAGIGIFFLCQIILTVFAQAKPYFINHYFLMGRVFVQSPQDFDWWRLGIVLIAYIGIFGGASITLFNKKDIVF